MDTHYVPTSTAEQQKDVVMELHIEGTRDPPTFSRLFPDLLGFEKPPPRHSWGTSLPEEVQLLAVCSGSAKLFLWTPNGCRTVPMPTETNFKVSSMQWSPDGETLLLLDRDRFCLSFIRGEDE